MENVDELRGDKRSEDGESRLRNVELERDFLKMLTLKNIKMNMLQLEISDHENRIQKLRTKKEIRKIVTLLKNKTEVKDEDSDDSQLSCTELVKFALEKLKLLKKQLEYHSLSDLQEILDNSNEEEEEDEDSDDSEEGRDHWEWFWQRLLSIENVTDLSDLQILNNLQHQKAKLCDLVDVLFKFNLAMLGGEQPADQEATRNQTFVQLEEELQFQFISLLTQAEVNLYLVSLVTQVVEEMIARLKDNMNETKLTNQEEDISQNP
ncbi:F-box only protein 8 isoform X2 [Cheilinus undulatus]|uniref:F-box only protein 8 isoform X2 n=1 Tax=Cheilinus undulatus TaxID=241271 RepID=UPI001BD22E7F|nr:F-box only protein 8 isoform X2 [Cheilinus undulatus]XP_041641217.1 F-box only protein 8 isoform X2 [Cheilinus undulatus]